MSNALARQFEQFNYNDQEIRIVMKEGEPWFVLSDVCKVLGLTNVTLTAQRLKDSEKTFCRVKGFRGPETLLVNEPGLYRVIFRSDRSEAAEFQEWVYHDVLPTIRKTGGYGTRVPQTVEELTSPELIIAVLGALNTQVTELKQKVEEQEVQLLEQGEHITQMEPKADYYDFVLQSPELVNTTTIAKDYGMSAQAFNMLLHVMKIQFKQGSMWHLYQKYACCGYMHSKTNSYSRKDGSQGTKMHSYWTHSGRLFLYETLKKEGILPIMEANVTEGAAGPISGVCNYLRRLDEKDAEREAARLAKSLS